MKMQELKFYIRIGNTPRYEIKTGIQVPQEMNYYYLPTDYKKPLKVRLISYQPFQGINEAMIFANISVEIENCVIPENIKLFTVSPNLLFASKNKASEYYLNHKDEFNFSYILDELEKVEDK